MVLPNAKVTIADEEFSRQDGDQDLHSRVYDIETGDDDHGRMCHISEVTSCCHLDEGDTLGENGEKHNDGTAGRKLLLSRNRVFGRDEELQVLKDAFGRVQSIGDTEAVIIHGMCGSGKTALVEAIRLPALEKGSYFGAGKYDSNPEGALPPPPFSGLVAALSDVVDQTLQNSTEVLQKTKYKMLELLGQDIDVLMAVVSNLALLVVQEEKEQGGEGYISRGPDHGATWSQAFSRFKKLCRKFLRALTEVVPVVLLLDDMQWADDESMEVIKDLMTDSDSKRLLLVCTYREESRNEGPSDAFLKFIDFCEITGGDSYDDFRVPISSIHVGNLRREDVRDLVATAMSIPSEEAAELSETVFTKTSGHPYLLVQYLSLLQNGEYLVYDDDSEKWVYDTAVIRTETCIESSALHAILMERLRMLPSDGIELLKLASCLGFKIEKKLLGKIFVEMGASSEMPYVRIDDTTMGYDRFQELIELVTSECLLEPGSNKNTLQFVHDQIRECLYGMVYQAGIAEMTHWKIGRFVKKDIQGCVSQESTMFLAVDQLYRGAHLMDLDEKVDLVCLLIEAGEFLMKTSAFGHSLMYLRRGFALLDPETSWSTHYRTTLNLHNALAECESRSGNYDQCERTITLVLNRALTMEDSLTCHSIRLYCLYLQGNMEKGLECGLELLEQLRERFPRKPHMGHVIWTIFRTMRISSNAAQKVQELPNMTDPNKVISLRILQRAMGFAFFLELDLLAPLITARMIQLTFLHGLCRDFNGFHNWGLIMSALGKHDEAYTFCSLALELVEESRDSESFAMVAMLAHGFGKHWREPIRDSLSPLWTAYTHGMKTGDIQNGLQVGASFLHASVSAGSVPLSVLELKAAEICKRMAEFGQEIWLVITAAQWQMIHCFMGRCENPLALTGEAMDQEEAIQHCTQSKNNAMGLFVMHMNLLKLSVFFQDWKRAVHWMSFLKQGGRGPKGLEGHFSVLEKVFWIGLVNLMNGRVRESRQSIRTLEKWLREGKDDSKAFLLFLLAEKFFVKNRKSLVDCEKVKEMFDAAIDAARESSCAHYQALAAERVASILRDMGQTNGSLQYFVLAKDVYCKWGALAKADLVGGIIDRIGAELS